MRVEQEVRSPVPVRVESMKDFLAAVVVGLDLKMAREVGFKANGEMEACITEL